MRESLWNLNMHVNVSTVSVMDRPETSVQAPPGVFCLHLQDAQSGWSRARWWLSNCWLYEGGFLMQPVVLSQETRLPLMSWHLVMGVPGQAVAMGYMGAAWPLESSTHTVIWAPFPCLSLSFPIYNMGMVPHRAV